MAAVEVVMPKMGESITDATIIKWFKKEGDPIGDEETLLEVATDKVDSEIPSPVAGIVTKILYKEDDVVDVGEVIAIIETEGQSTVVKEEKKKTEKDVVQKENEKIATIKEDPIAKATPKPLVDKSKEFENEPQQSTRFYSPLVKSIAAKEKIDQKELDNIPGSGANGRVTKKDLLNYINSGRAPVIKSFPEILKPAVALESKSAQISEGGDEIIEMDRMRKLIADHMVHSKKTSPHVTSFAEADVTGLFDWRNKVKETFLEKYGVKLSLTPIIIEILAKAIQKHPMLNSSVDGNKLIIKKDINIGMATALPSGNLIVPVIHNADQFNLNGLAKKVNNIAEKARSNSLNISEIQKGTFTLTNIGTYGSQLGTPIINQPQVAILATGAIKKKPVVIESDKGDTIGIRQMMYLSMSYDHRVIDGYLGGTFLQTVISLLENFDDNREI